MCRTDPKTGEMRVEGMKRNRASSEMSIEDEYLNRVTQLARFSKNPLRLFKEFFKLVDLIIQDLDKCVDIANNHLGDNTWQRIVIRVAFSTIDSYCYKLNELVYCMAKFSKHKLTRDDEDFLVGYKKGKNNNITRCYPGLSDYVKRTLRISSDFFASNPVDFGDAQWGTFLKSIEIRDKVTHPKNPADLIISQQEYYMVSDAYAWFSKRVFEITVASSGVAKVKWMNK